MFFFSLVFSIFSIQLIAEEPTQALESGLMYIFSNDFGYTLIGEKPVSVEQRLNWDLGENPDKKNQLFSFLDSAFHQSNNFIFKILGKDGYIELVHKKSLIKQIYKNDNLNEFIKKKYGSIKKFLKFLKKSDSSIFSAVDYSSVLIAVVLGYGAENGEFFARRIEVGEYLQKYPIVTFFPFDQKPGPWHAFPSNSYFFSGLFPINEPQKKPQFSSLEREWQEIQKNEQQFNRESVPPYYIALPTYVAKAGIKSEAILDNFSQARKRLALLFCGKKFSEAIADEVSKTRSS
jgi:hypothetical protein